MKRDPVTDPLRRGVFLAVLVAGLILMPFQGHSPAATYTLQAGTTTYYNPDTLESVPMWGFGLVGGAITVPGPVLVVPPGDTTLNITLTNNLPQNISLVIPGLQTVLSPTNVGGRVMSFTTEAAANGGTQSYTWTNVKPGTYIYQSGTNPAVQVQMGLYGAVKKDFAAGQVYNNPNSVYNSEAIIFLSEIDPVIHGHVAGGTYGAPPPTGITSTIDYRPKYFLINGRTYSSTTPPTPIYVSGAKVLLRFLNAGLQTHVPLLYGGVYMKIMAENGNPYSFLKEQYTHILPAGATAEAIIAPAAAMQIPIFDRRLNLSNAAQSPGGMLTYLNYYVPFKIYLPIIAN